VRCRAKAFKERAPAISLSSLPKCESRLLLAQIKIRSCYRVCVCQLYQWGYARVTAHNGSYLEWHFVDSQNGGAVLDRMAIWQDPAAIAADIAARNPFFAGPASGDDGSDDGGGGGGSGDDGVVPGGADDDPGASSRQSSLAVLCGAVSAAAVVLLASLWCAWARTAKRSVQAQPLSLHGNPHSMLAQDDGLSCNGDGSLDLRDATRSPHRRSIKPRAFLASADKNGDPESSAVMHPDVKNPYNADAVEKSFLRFSGAEQLTSRLVESPLQAAADSDFERGDV
jgi:hypothetical protein